MVGVVVKAFARNRTSCLQNRRNERNETLPRRNHATIPPIGPSPCPVLLFLLQAVAPAASDFPEFKMQELDPHAGNVVYAVSVADVNGDGQPDVCALTEDAIVWYENPSWTRHEILKGATQKAAGTARDNVCFAPFDIDDDGDSDFAIGADWRPTDTQAGGTLFWARQDSLDDWALIPIGSEPTVHRLRWANVLGDNWPELVVVPLQGRGTSGPNWGSGAGSRILVYAIPDDPTEDDWTMEVAEETLHTTHNLQPTDWDGDGRDELVIASWEGVFLLDFEGGKWNRTKLGSGNQEAEPFKGSSEVKVGRLVQKANTLQRSSPGTVIRWLYMEKLMPRESSGSGPSSTSL